MPQKIDVHGLFLDPEAITELLLQKRTSIFYPVFYEAESQRSIFGKFISSRPQYHVLRFDHQEPYGIILADAEQPDPASYVVNYKEAAINRLFKGLEQAGKSITGHIVESLKIEISGDRKYRILQAGRIVKQTSIREIPAKVRLLNGQWVDVFSSSPDYDFQGNTPYAVADVRTYALTISTKENNYVLYGAGVDALDEEVESAYYNLAEIYNQIQEKHNLTIEKKMQIPAFRMPQIKIELPKFENSSIKLRSPIVLGKKTKDKDQDSDEVIGRED